MLNARGTRATRQSEERSGEAILSSPPSLPARRAIRRLGAALLILCSVIARAQTPPTREETLAAMRKAADFWAQTVAYRGGYVELYSEDLKQRWGEIPARDTMIWVQDPGTTSIGRLFLDIYQSLGDETYLRYAKAAANALVWGQHPSGGWHYFIDFDMPGVPQWYEDVAKKCWGWMEYSHYYGNCAFDDNVTAGAADFLLDLYLETQDPAYREPLLKALDFVLESQYPLGGWPQRYPLMHDHPLDGQPDYTSFYTFNDGVISGNIELMLKAHRLLGRDAYWDAALRGMCFVMLSQEGEPQPGWGQQYDLNLNNAPARSYEPASLMPSQTAENVQNLMTYYKITGQSRFLSGIPAALDWLDRARLPESHTEGIYTHATFVEIGTDRPLYAHREGDSQETGRYWLDYEPVDILPGYGFKTRIDVDALRKEYERVKALTPEEARAEYEASLRQTPARSAVTAAQARQIIESLDGRGAWVEDLQVPDYHNYIKNPPHKFRGMSARTFQRNMSLLLIYAAESPR